MYHELLCTSKISNGLNAENSFNGRGHYKIDILRNGWRPEKFGNLWFKCMGSS